MLKTAVCRLQHFVRRSTSSFRPVPPQVVPSSTSNRGVVIGTRSSSSSSFTSPTSLKEILEKVSQQNLTPEEAEEALRTHDVSSSPETILTDFAQLDHTRALRTGFPEAVFAEQKTAAQVSQILDEMARHVNDEIDAADGTMKTANQAAHQAILATRVTPEEWDKLKRIPVQHGVLEYHEIARIVEMTASRRLVDIEDMSRRNTMSSSASAMSRKRIIVATAGTTDLPVAEEAAVTLEAAHMEVERIPDVGVAGLHRIVRALPRLQHPDVGCIIVCAGMDGALPSVVGGLARVPVIAVPTSIGYGVSLGGISAMLTMLNTCAPGVGTVNIDNGFGAAALAYKIVST